MDQSEETTSWHTKTKRETNISDLPLEILERIFQDYLTQLSDEKLIIFHTIGFRFARIASCHLSKRNLCFNGYTTLKQEDVLHALSFSGKPLRVNINDCYWFTPSSINRLITTVPLQKLRIINFDLSCDDIASLFQLELTNLSMKWTSNWASACQQTTDRSGALWTTLKSVKVLFKKDDSISKFPDHFLCHCPSLDKIKTKLEGDKIIKTMSGYLFRNFDPRLTFKFANCVNVSDFMMAINANKNEEIYFKFRSEQDFSKIVSSRPDTPLKRTISGGGSEFKNLDESCKKIKVFGLSLPKHCSQNFWEIAESIKELRTTFSNYRALDVQTCNNLEFFPTGLSLVTGQLTEVSYLDITMLSIQLTDEDKHLVIEGVSRLKKLKTLFMNAYFISFLPTPNENVDRFTSISVDTIEKSSMALVTNCCKNISFLKLVGNYQLDQKSECVPEANLAAISKLEHLLELHLVDVLTLGSGESLSLITKGCTKLRALQLKDVNFSEKQKSIEESLLHAKSIRELCIYQKIELSEKLVHNLSELLHLEKLGLEGVSVTLDQLGYLNNILIKMESLYVLRLVTENTIEFPTSLIWNLALINSSKPAFRYELRNQENLLNEDTNKINHINNLIELEWPPIHQNIFQYSSLKQNS